jgi:hypothetical protein
MYLNTYSTIVLLLLSNDRTFYSTMTPEASPYCTALVLPPSHITVSLFDCSGEWSHKLPL